MKKFGLIFLFSILLFQACGEGEGTSWSRFLSLEYWRTQKEIQDLITQGNQASQNGNHAFAIGKFRKAYRLAPEKSQIPLQIAKEYAFLAVKNPDAEMEKKESIYWLMQAYRANPDLSLKEIQQAPFGILKDLDFYQSLVGDLKENSGNKRDERSWITKRLTSIQAIVRETQVISQQLGRIFGFFYRLFDWIGFQIILFFLCILVICSFFRILGFSFNPSILLLSFLLTILIWHLTFRVATGGASGGWHSIIRLSLVGLAVLLVLKALPIALNYGWNGIQRKLRSSSFYYHTFKSPRGEKRKDLRKYLFNLEEANEKLLKIGYQILAHKTGSSSDKSFKKPNSEQLKELMLEIELVRKQIHEMTEKTIE